MIKTAMPSMVALAPVRGAAPRLNLPPAHVPTSWTTLLRTRGQEKGAAPPRASGQPAATAHAVPNGGKGQPEQKESLPPVARHDDEPRGGRGSKEEDALDPMARHTAQLAPPGIASALPIVEAVPEPPAITMARSSLEELLPAMVKRVAWFGDAKRGAIRLEIGAGALAGGTLLVEADGGRVKVRLDAPPGADAAEWKERIQSRLTARGIALESVEVE